MLSWDLVMELIVEALVHTHTHSMKQMRRLDEAMADVTKFHSTQQRDSWKTNDLQIFHWNRKANRLHLD